MKNRGHVSPSVEASFGQHTTGSPMNRPGGRVFSLHVSSVDSRLLYFQLYDRAYAPSDGDIAKYSFPVGAGAATQPTVMVIGEDFFGTEGVVFSKNGIAWGISTDVKNFVDAQSPGNFVMHLHYLPEQLM